MKIRVCNLKKYNEGEAVDEIIALPTEDSKIKDVIRKYTNNHQNDLAILEYDLPFDISEYENLIKVNEVCKLISEENIEPSMIFHIEHDKGEKIIELSREELLSYISEVDFIKATTKKEFCIEYFEKIGVNFKEIPDEMRNAIDWEVAFDQLEMRLCITQDKDNKKFYYNHIN